MIEHNLTLPKFSAKDNLCKKKFLTFNFVARSVCNLIVMNVLRMFKFSSGPQL